MQTAIFPASALPKTQQACRHDTEPPSEPVRPILCRPSQHGTKLALRDESDTYIRENVFDNIVFYPENFSFVSEKSGYNHLYWYSIGGNLLKQVTAGPYEVQEFLGYDPEEGSFYFSSNEESPMRSAIYKIDRKGKKTRLSSQAGTNSAQFSANMKYYMNRYSNLDTPTVITLNDNTGKTTCHPDGQCGIEAGNQRL